VLFSAERDLAYLRGWVTMMLDMDGHSPLPTAPLGISTCPVAQVDIPRHSGFEPGRRSSVL